MLLVEGVHQADVISIGSTTGKADFIYNFRYYYIFYSDASNAGNQQVSGYQLILD